MSKNLHIKIGSGKGNHVILNHEQVADVHLELFADEEGNVFITDLGSDKGTTVNGETLRGFRQMQLGDEVVLGKKVKFNWQKYRIEKKATPKKAAQVPDIQMEKPPQKSNKKQELQANLEVEHKQLIIIFGAIALILFFMYMIN